MFLAFILTILGSLSTIFWKKSLNLTKLEGVRFMFFGYIGDFLISILFLIIGRVDLNIIFHSEFILLILGIMLSNLIYYGLEQSIYKNEKYSVLMPFENLDKIFVIIIGFFLFAKSSLIQLLITLLAIITIFLFDIDYKNFQMPKFFARFALSSFFQALSAILTGFIVLKASAETIFFFGQLGELLIILTMIIYICRSKIFAIFKQSKSFYTYRLSQNIFRGVSYMMGLYLLKELGIITTTLLSFLGMVSSLIFSYIFLKEIPGRKDVILAFIVSALIGIGYYFG